MKIVQKKCRDLKPADYNPRKMTPSERSDIKDSLQKFGFVDPVIINSNSKRKNIIIGGHQRCKVWSEDLGQEKVHCVEVDLSLSRERELNIRLNKNNAGWDKDLLNKFFSPEELINWGFSMGELDIKLPEVLLPGTEVPVNTEMEGDIKFSQEIDESSNYVVLKFDKDVDFLHIQTLLGLGSVHARHSNGSAGKKGIGRVVDGIKALDLIRNGGERGGVM